MLIRTGLVSVNANQFLNGKFEGAAKIHTATGGGPFGSRLELVPEGLEVFGATTNAVQNPVTDKLIEVKNTDWVLEAPSGNIIVVTDEDFKTNYLDFVGVIATLATLASDPI